MFENRINKSIVLHIHKEKLDNYLSLIDIGNYFVEVNECRKLVLGKFDPFDLRKSSVHTKSVDIQVMYIHVCLSEIPQEYVIS